MVSPPPAGPAKNVIACIPTRKTSQWRAGNSQWVSRWPAVNIINATVKVNKKNGTAIITMQVSLAALEEPYTRTVEVDVSTLTIKHGPVERYIKEFDAAFDKFKEGHEDEVTEFFSKKSSQVLEGEYSSRIDSDVVKAFVAYVTHSNVYNKIHAIQKQGGPCAYELLLSAFDEFKVLDVQATKAAMTAIEDGIEYPDTEDDSNSDSDSDDADAEAAVDAEAAGNDKAAEGNGNDSNKRAKTG